MRGFAKLGAVALLWLAPAVAQARPWIYGFTLPSWWSDAYAKPAAQQSLSDLAKTGAGWVALIPTWYMTDSRSSGFAPTQQTASDESVEQIIDESRRLHLHVVLKPHINCQDGSDTGTIWPKDQELWLRNYRDFLLHYAVIAQKHQVELLVIGTELTTMAGPNHRKEWDAMIQDVRKVYSGKLTFATHFYDFMLVPFWDKLDFIGVDGYFPLLGGSNTTLLKLGWLPYRSALRDISREYGKPLLFTEIGISSQKGANHRPWSYGDFGSVDTQTQKAYFQAFLEMFADESYFAGFLQWCWELNPDAGGPGDKSMTVQHKPALTEILEPYFRQLNAPDEVRAYTPRPIPLSQARQTLSNLQQIVGSLPLP